MRAHNAPANVSVQKLVGSMAQRRFISISAVRQNGWMGMGMGMSLEESLNKPRFVKEKLRAFSVTNGISSQRQPTQTAGIRMGYVYKAGISGCGECAECVWV